MLKISFDQKYIYPLEENHRFPMIKYELIPEQLIRENTCCHDNFFSPKQILDKDVLLTHEKSYFQKLVSQTLSKSELRPIGFPMSNDLVEREKIISQGTIDCALFSLENNISMLVAPIMHFIIGERLFVC